MRIQPRRPEYENMDEKYIIEDFIGKLRRNEIVNDNGFNIEIMMIHLEYICSQKITEKWRNYLMDIARYCYDC